MLEVYSCMGDWLGAVGGGGGGVGVGVHDRESKGVGLTPTSTTCRLHNSLKITVDR